MIGTTVAHYKILDKLGRVLPPTSANLFTADPD